MSKLLPASNFTEAVTLDNGITLRELVKAVREVAFELRRMNERADADREHHRGVYVNDLN